MRILAGLVALATLLPAGRADEPTKEALRNLEDKLKDTYQQVAPSVACVVVSRSDKYPVPAKSPEHAGQLGGFDRAEFLKAHPRDKALAARLDLTDPEAIPDHGSAGGVVIDPAGYVLVNYHTIDGATKIYVHLPGSKGSYADIRAADARSDLAVLTLLTPPADLKAIPFATARLPDFPNDAKATLFPGKVLVLMACTSAPGPKVTEPSIGLSSVRSLHRVGRPNNAMSPSTRRDFYDYGTWIEYEARLNPASGGAVLLNLDGEMVGFTSTVAAVPATESLGYAVPADDIFRRIVGVLRRGEEVEYGLLGMTHKTDSQGVVIGSVTSGSPAAAAGLLPLDTITRIDGHLIGDFNDLLYHGGAALAGTKIRVAYKRDRQDQKEHETTLTLAKFRSEFPFIASVRPAPLFGLRIDYASILTPTVVAMNDFTAIPTGVAVRDLVPGSPAAAKFKALGDNTRWAITHVNGTPVLTPADFYRAAKVKPSVKLTVIDPADPRPKDVTLP